MFEYEVVQKFDNTDAVIEAIHEGTAKGLEAAAQEEVRRIRQGFASGTDALGRPWTPLAPSTIRQTGPTILVDTGDMRDSIGYQMSDNGLAVHLGSDHPLVPIHEYGTARIPSRPIIRPAYTDLRENVLKRTLADHIRSFLKKIRLMIPW